MSQLLQTGTNSSDVKSQNLSAILLTLLHHPAVSRVHLSQQLGVSTATITNLVNELVDLGLVIEDGTLRTNGQSNVGRPQRALRLVPEARYAVGVHINVGEVRVVLTNLRAEVLQTRTIHHALSMASEAVLEQIGGCVQELIDTERIDPLQIVGVGVAASGLVDNITGVNVLAPNLNWHNVPIQAYLTDRLHLDVVVDNNVRAMALGEAMFGAARHVHAVAFVYARIGVGAGLVVGGQLYRGAAAGAGEIGHTTIMVDDPCEPDSYRSLESLVSEPVIINAARKIAHENPDGIMARQFKQSGRTLDDIFQAAKGGDVGVQRMIEQRACYMGIALANLVNVFNPELIVLGGIFLKERGLMLPTIETTVRQLSFANLGEKVRLQTTEFGDHAGMIGAAALALDRYFYRTYTAPVQP